MERECEECGHPISEKRLKAVPDATLCVNCLEMLGDVPRYLGIRTPIEGATKHLDGCDSNIIRNPETIKKHGTLYKYQKYPE